MMCKGRGAGTFVAEAFLCSEPFNFQSYLFLVEKGLLEMHKIVAQGSPAAEWQW